jgi:hypothetical protein
VLLALAELRHYGFLLLTRQGGLHQCSLFALSWNPIHDCGGKLDCSPTITPSGDWKQLRERFKRPPKKQSTTPASVPDRYGIRSSEDKKAA